MKPQLGFGTWQYPQDKVKHMTKLAITKYGYRQFDTAKMYQNENQVGEAIKECIDESLVKREELFITTKLWIDGRGRVREELKESLQRLKLDYVDMYIMHFMVPDIDPSNLEVKRDSLMDV